jgi:ABC-type multidrug transport system ATPase subunit
MCTAEARVAGSTEQSALLQVENLAKHYRSRRVPEGLSLTVRSGEIVGLVGANGCGKTTVLRILAGLLVPDTGRGTVLGFDLLRDRHEIRRRTGYMSQRFSLYAGLSVRENLRFRAEVFGLQEPRTAVAAVVERFDLRPLEKLAADRLSGGWARLVQLAAALVHRPRLLLLDEPTTGLDAAARQAVWRHLARLAAEGAAIVLSSHDLVDASRCTRISCLAQGRVVGSGSPSDVALATRATVLAIRGGRVLGLIEPLQAIPGVIASYPSGDCLRVVIEPAAAAAIGGCTLLADFVVERVSPTLEDAALEWSGPRPVVRG